MSRVRVELLGPVRVLRDRDPVRVGGPIPRMLLTELVLADAHAVPDQVLIDAVWGDEAPDTVDAALRVHISTLRSALGSVGLGVERRHLGYVVEGDFDTDLAELDRLESSMGDDPTTRLAAGESALALWRGPSLADLRRLPRGARIGVHLDRRRELLVNQHGRLLVELDRNSDAIQLLEPALARDPLDEQRWALLARAVAQTGRQAEALRALAQARAELAEVGLVAGPIIAEAERLVLEPSTHPVVDYAPVVVLPSELAGLAELEMFGRDDELAALLHEIRDATTRPRSTIVSVRGESGAGKTVFLAHLARALVADGVPTSYTAADQVGEPALAPLARLVGFVRGQWLVKTDEEEVTDWSADEPDPVAERTAAIEWARQELEQPSFSLPRVLILDDAQWADELTRSLVQQLGRLPLDRPLIVVVAQRADAKQLAPRGAYELLLRRFRADEVARWLGLDPQAPEAHQLADMTGGLAWLVAEAGHLIHRGLPVETVAGYIAPRLLRDRIDALSADVVRLLHWAGTLGATVVVDHLATVCGQDSLVMAEGLDQLIEARVLVDVPNDPAKVRWGHDLVRHAVLEQIGPRRSSRMHWEARTALADRLSPVDRCRHALAAPYDAAPDDVVTDGASAAQWLLDQGAYEEAWRLTGSVWERLGDHTAEAGGVVTLHIASARAAIACSDAAAARLHLDRADVAATASGDDLAAAETVIARGMLGHRVVSDRGLPTRIRALLDRLADADPTIRFALHRRHAFELLHQGSLEHAGAALDAAIPLVAVLGDRAAAEFASLQHWLAESSGDAEERRRAAHTMRDAADRSSDPAILSRAAATSAIEALHRGDHGAATAAIDEMEQVAAAERHPHGIWLARSARFTPAFVTGDLDDAARRAAEAHEYGRSHLLAEAQGAYATQMFAIAWVRGELAPFVEPLAKLRASGPDLVWRAALALALVAADDVVEAESVLDSTVEALVPSAGHWLGFVGVCIAVEAAAALDHTPVLDRARPLLARRRDDHALLGTGAMDYGPVARYEALTCAGLDDMDQAHRLLEQVRADPSSGELWRRRAELDLAWLGERSPRGLGTFTGPTRRQGRP